MALEPEYNSIGAGGLPALKPESASGYFHVCSCRTTVGPRQPRREEYSYPGVSGVGSRRYGFGARQITWLIQGVIDADDLEDFEVDLNAYTTGAAYILTSERVGEVYQYVELMTWEYVRPPEHVAGAAAKRYVELRVTFAELQP